MRRSTACSGAMPSRPAWSKPRSAPRRSVFNLRQLRERQPYRLVKSLDGLLEEFEYQIDADRFLRIVTPRSRPVPRCSTRRCCRTRRTRTIETVRGHDRRRPPVADRGDDRRRREHPAGDGAGRHLQQPDRFRSDLQPGDRFEVLVEKSSRDGQFAGYGADPRRALQRRRPRARGVPLVQPRDGARRLLRRGRPIAEAVHAADSAQVRAADHLRLLAQSPASRSFRTYRAHLGIDYAAPVGAPVVAVSSGVVVSAGWAGGGGNQIQLRHGDGYETLLPAPVGLRPGHQAGVHVDQGQLIGRVGATGTATGPHLDYRLKRNGAFVNPLVGAALAAAGRSDSAGADARPSSPTRDSTLRQLSADDARRCPGRPAEPSDAVRTPR